MPKVRMFYGWPLYCALSGFVKTKSNSLRYRSFARRRGGHGATHHADCFVSICEFEVKLAQVPGIEFGGGIEHQIAGARGLRECDDLADIRLVS